MASEPSPLKYMGAQGPQTVHLAAAMAHTVETSERGDLVVRRLSRELGHGSRAVADDSRLAAATRWAIAKAAALLRSAGRHLRRRAARALARPIRSDPVRAVLVAAAIGAVLMSLLTMTARSGARAAERRVRR